MNSLQHIINRRDWENPISVQVNQVKAHSPLMVLKALTMPVATHNHKNKV